MSELGTKRCWDHEDCPRDDCDGELQQQDQFNVMCLSCEGVWTHVKSETKHYLQTGDFETVAEKPVAMTDGGTEHCEIGDRLEAVRGSGGHTILARHFEDGGRETFGIAPGELDGVVQRLSEISNANAEGDHP